MDTGNLLAREMRHGDVELIADYWSQSTPDNLIGMGVDLQKMPIRSDFVAMLSAQLDQSLEKRQFYCTIWEVNDQPIGHCNVNNITFGEEAYMHLHVWKSDSRRHGYGIGLVHKSLPFFFGGLHLRSLYCEPYAKNLAPNRVLEKVGFDFIRKYKTVPGAINFEQDVNRWHLSHAKWASLIA